jgi:hypothetical protein
MAGRPQRPRSSVATVFLQAVAAHPTACVTAMHNHERPIAHDLFNSHRVATVQAPKDFAMGVARTFQ